MNFKTDLQFLIKKSVQLKIKKKLKWFLQKIHNYSIKTTNIVNFAINVLSIFCDLKNKIELQINYINTLQLKLVQPATINKYKSFNSYFYDSLIYYIKQK